MGEVFYGSHRAEETISNQTKSVLVLVLIKSFTCQSLTENYFGAKMIGWFLGRQPLKTFNNETFTTKVAGSIKSEP